MSAAELPFDIGLQAERTALAWRRTSLALVVAAAVGAKVLFGPFGYGAVAVAAVGLIIALLVRLFADRRYRATHRWLTHSGEGHPPAPGAAALALCTALVFGVGLTALAYVLAAAVAS